MQGKKDNHLQKNVLSTTSNKLEAAKAIGASGNDEFQVLSSSSVKSHTNSLHTTAKVENSSSAHVKGSKMTPADKIPAVANHSSKLVNKKRHKTTPKSTTEQSTTEETTTESTTTETTTEEITTIEETTTETTTIEETTTETTTIEETTTEATTTETTDSATEKAISKPTPRIKSSPTDDSGVNNSTTKSWQKYLAKTTPSSKANSAFETTAISMSKSDEDLLMKSAEKASSTTKGHYQKSTPSLPYVNTRPPNNSVQDNNQNSADGVRVKKTYTSSPNAGTSEASTTPSNTSVDVKVDIDIDIKLGSSLVTEEGNASVETSSSSATTTTHKNREKRHQKKKVLAGVILVVLISLSAAFAILFVLVPAKSEVRTRRYHGRPDQVELIGPGRRCHPRFYDASMYMGH